MPHPLKEESWTIRSTLFFMPSNRKRYFCHQITNLLYNCKHYLMLSNWKVTFTIQLKSHFYYRIVSSCLRHRFATVALFYNLLFFVKNCFQTNALVCTITPTHSNVKWFCNTYGSACRQTLCRYICSSIYLLVFAERVPFISFVKHFISNVWYAL